MKKVLLEVPLINQSNDAYLNPKTAIVPITMPAFDPRIVRKAPVQSTEAGGRAA